MTLIPVVVPISTMDDLAVHGDAYDRFIAAIPDGQSVFYSRAWLAAMMPLYCPMQGQLLFLLALADGEVVGLAPLCFANSSRGKWLVRRLTNWGAEQHSLMVEANVFIAPGTNVVSCIQAFRDYLFRVSPERIDCVDLRYIPSETECLANLQKVFPRTKVGSESMDSYQIDLRGSFEAFIEARSKSLMKQLAKLERALARDVEFVFQIQDTLTPAELADIASLHSRRQTELVDAGRSRFSLFQDDCAASCYGGALEALSESRQACFYFLRSKGAMIAVLTAFRSGSVLVGHLTAFDSAYAKYSPGKLLHLKVIEAEIQRAQHSRIDLMPGRTKVKTDFCDIVHPRLRVVLINSYRWQSLARYALWSSLVHLADFATTVLDRAHELRIHLMSARNKV